MNNTDNFNIMHYSTYYYEGQISMIRLFNCALTGSDATDLAIINGGDVPFKYRGASQTDLLSG